MNNVWIIAQAGNNDVVSSEPISSTQGDTANNTVTDGSNGGQPGQETQKPQGFPVWIIGLMLVFMVFMMLTGPRKQKKERKKLEDSLEKNDRVVTIGGIYGTIVEIKDAEVTLKVDESNNTKIKVTRSAIGRNMSKD